MQVFLLPAALHRPCSNRCKHLSLLRPHPPSPTLPTPPSERRERPGRRPRRRRQHKPQRGRLCRRPRRQRRLPRVQRRQLRFRRDHRPQRPHLLPRPPLNSSHRSPPLSPRQRSAPSLLSFTCILKIRCSCSGACFIEHYDAAPGARVIIYVHQLSPSLSYICSKPSVAGRHS
jgi:hypothetical protein